MENVYNAVSLFCPCLEACALGSGASAHGTNHAISPLLPWRLLTPVFDLVSSMCACYGAITHALPCSMEY